MSSLLRFGNPLHWIPGPSQETPLRRKNPASPPATAHRIPATIPKTGYVGAKPMCYMRFPLFLSPTRNPQRNAPASCPQAFQMHRYRRRRQRSTSNACPSLFTPQQRGDAHSRTCTQTCITARQPNRMPLHILLVTPGLAGQPVTAQAAPKRGDPRPVGPQKESGQSKGRILSS